jgi:hypothetical protein
MIRRQLLPVVGLVLSGLLLPYPVLARDAAFVEPGTVTAKGGGGEALTADPKLYEAGESNVGIARRVTLFFANVGGNPLSISDVSTAGDGNVTAQMTANDCQKNGKLIGGSRCSVTLTITPTSSGPWSVEVLTTHDGPGRIARAVVSGKALNDAKTAGSGEGLNQNSKEVKPVDFGEVDANGDPAVRTTLMVNDSPEDIAIMAIDLIAVNKGLDRLDQGCVPDQILKPGESCPVTLRWTPYGKVALVTDLIIRHTAKIGFTVIPVRGHTVGGVEIAGEEDGNRTGRLVKTTRTGLLLPPPSATEIDSLAVKIPPVQAQELTHGNDRTRLADGDDAVYFIGQVGNRAILQHNGLTKVVASASEAEIDDVNVKLLRIGDKIAYMTVNGKARNVKLKASGYRPLPSVKKDKQDFGKTSSQNAVTSSNSQSSSGKQNNSTNSGSDQNGAPIYGR